MTADDFVSAIDGLTFDENGRTWTLEVDDIDDGERDALSVVVSILESGELRFDVPTDRELDVAMLQDHVVGIARSVVNGREPSGVRTIL